MINKKLNDIELLKFFKLKKKDLKKKTNFFSKLDSIDTMNVIANLEKKLKIKINLIKIIEIDNLKDLKKYLKL
jgi:acyl carrier protein